jgi:HD superfamily phosphohydrolase
VVSAEQMLIKILQRAKELSQNKQEVFGTTNLQMFLKNNYSLEDFDNHSTVFKAFSDLDDYDIMASVKEWQNHPDKILSTLSNKMVKRQLLKVELLDEPMEEETILKIKNNIKESYDIDVKNMGYLFFQGEITNNAYKLNDSEINILFKNNISKNLMEAVDKSTISALCKTVKKYFYCYPKNCQI